MMESTEILFVIS